MVVKFNPKIGDLVYFRWLDHCTYRDASWLRAAEDIVMNIDPNVYETVGFVVNVTPTYITLMTTIGIDEDPEGSQVCTRLRSAITQGKILKRFRK